MSERETADIEKLKRVADDAQKLLKQQDYVLKKNVKLLKQYKPE